MGWVVLLLTSGCLRFGYKSHPAVSFAPDAGRDDASARTDIDAAQSGSGASGGNAGGSGMKDAAPTEAGAGKGGMDAQTVQDAGSMSPTDAGMDAAVSDADATTPGMMDAGATDAAISDAGTDAWVGSGLLCPPDALFCDGYETYTSSGGFKPPWDYSILTNGTADQSTMAHTGVGALHAKTGAAHPNTPTTNAARWGKSLIFNQQKSGDVWARWYYYVPSSTSVTTLFSTGVIAELDPPYFGFSMIIRPARVDIGQGDVFYPGTAAFPRDRWVCVELHAVVAAAPSGVFELYLDGTLQIHVTSVNTLPSTGYSSFDLGIHYTDPSQGPVEAYADDVAAGTTRLGCVP